VVPTDGGGEAQSPEDKPFMVRSSQARGAAHEAWGASPDEAAQASGNTLRFYDPTAD
jgi:hypothetical protein